MKIAVIGSRNVNVSDIGRYISNAEEIVSGGAVGVDRCAAEYAKENGIRLTEFLPQYERYGRRIPFVVLWGCPLRYGMRSCHGNR